MKKELLSIVSLLIVICLSAQNVSSDYKPDGMEFVPAGSFQTKMTLASEPRIVKVSVEAFWMSNEITNREYREFVDWAKKNPSEKIYQVKYSKEVSTDSYRNIKKDTVIRKINVIDVSGFSSEMLDNPSLEKVNKKFNNYFTDKKYNDYPVVGISFKMAEYYCLWKTMIENKKRKEKGLPDVHAFRIPLETEWEYAANQPIAKKIQTGNKVKSVIQKANEGDSNYFGLYHLDDNVAEWVVTVPKENHYVVRGGSWKSRPDIFERFVSDSDCKDGHIGFRIVQSYISTPLK
jgi:formylglycine-generating enzyme required for sulfatase activity